MEDQITDTRTDAELDSLADGNTAPAPERQMQETPAPAAAAPAPTTAWLEDEIDYGGKKIKGTREQILKWAQMGYDRPQWAQRFNQEKQTWEKQRADWEKSWGAYREIDEWAAKNPDAWKHIEQSWQNRHALGAPAGIVGGTGTAGVPGADPAQAFFRQFEERFAPRFEKMENELTAISKERIAAKERQEDDALTQEIGELREKYPDLLAETLDENGNSPERRVMLHAGQIGTNSFRVAFRDLFHDELVQRAASQGKIAVAKGIQDKTKLGVLGSSPTPQSRRAQVNRNIRDTSYEELENEIREELRSGRVG